MDKAFYKKIINLIPSEDMRKFVFNDGFKFREKDLLRIILNYAPNLDTRLNLFDEAAQKLDDKQMRVLAKKRIAFEIKQRDAFMQASDDTVYQIKIKTGEYVEDEYIVKTFDDAVSLIKSHLKHYEIKGNERAGMRCTLTKFSTRLPEKPSDLGYKHYKVGEIGKCVLDDKFRIIDLDTYSFGREVKCKSGVECEECDRCIDNMFSTRFPHFLKKYDLVAYYGDLIYNPKKLTYGVFAMDMEECDYDSYIVSLEDNLYIQNRNGDYKDENEYYRIFDAHEHPSCFTIVKPDISQVPQKIRDDYEYAQKILKMIEET